ncbi:uncharacterized protein LOC130825697 [Amaranthus tricolor]|uniref:uncharacterized protein LOC130825697 n=1 Tax=Amaranthus tricolor TaxID=29722 RepID=UPI00259124EC|nr:uncharacterized protein LOC130825697 [Amaranthus tricolor]
MSTASYGRSRSGDRFYCPPQVRRQNQLRKQELLVQKQKLEEKDEIRRQKQPNQQLNHHQLRRNKSLANDTVVQQEQRTSTKSTSSSENRVESDDCASSTATTTTTNTTATTTTTFTPAASVSSHLTNLDRFLEFTTPSVPVQYFAKSSLKGWRNQEEFQRYFVLGDLWESFKEWSAYGAGVPLLLNGIDSVVQYYVPYLSGIQLYTDPSKPSLRTRMPGEESDESSRETCSDGSSDCETGFSESTLQGMKGLSLRYKPFNGSSSDEGDFSSSPGVLIFEYFEHAPPFSREPLADKISLLASQYPGLKTYRSCDLTPSSWISVAWYPIYRIPTGPTLQNLDSCFLTFHSLSTPLCGGYPREIPNGFHMVPKMPLPIFGMASYKFKISVWDQNGEESQKANSLLQAADEWLRVLNVNHPDYRFFISRNFNCR